MWTDKWYVRKSCDPDKWYDVRKSCDPDVNLEMTDAMVVECQMLLAVSHV